ncbi:MAG: ABC transporter ATP-binding protein [Chlamydiae bacterium]|nr:ABC transporter ATP-binding protein [Chlamydiota bacterium]MBI3267203.1 ABC transporter ATP-binding protein [Chlamydiota bacterium]
MQSPYAIETDELEKRYGKTVAVQNLNLKIKRGEFFAFLGPNAAGKTTTLRMLTGLIPPTKGRIKILGLDLPQESLAIKRKIGYIPDFPFLYEKLTAYEFLNFIARLYSLDESFAAQEIEKLLHQFDLSSDRDRLIETFSHGLRQRLVFSATLLHQPELILADEPMVGLDPKSAKLVRETLKKLTRQGSTVFVSTHTLSLAEELADRIGIIHKGRLIAIGTSEELKSKTCDAPDLEALFLTLTQEESNVPPL